MIDLHTHSKISDGSHTTEELIELAISRGITHLAITDHDTTKGLKEAVILGQQKGITVIPGIEISAYDDKRSSRAHLLGFFIEEGNVNIEGLCAPLTQKRNEASIEMVNRLIENGYKITWDEVAAYAEGGTGVYKQHIMRALVDKGYCDKIYGELYKKLFKRPNNGEEAGALYIHLEYVDAIAAIKAIRAAGGVAVLAHPGQLNNFEAVEEWVSEGLQGIEAFHESHREEDLKRALELAEKFNLVVTGGSDYHGLYGESEILPGCEKLSVDYYEKLYERFLSNKIS